MVATTNTNTNQRCISTSKLIQAPAKQVYNIIADYKEWHPKIIPKPPFIGIDVIEGNGVGDGTKIIVHMKILGIKQAIKADITEPEPGRVLVETVESGYVTTFTVDPKDDDDGKEATLVTIRTDMTKDGIPGTIEYWFVNWLFGQNYVKELDLLEEVAKSARE